MSEVIAFPAPKVAPRVCTPLESETVPDDAEWHVCPWSDTVTAYDKQNIGLFYRLIHDESEGASEADIARDVFGIDIWFQSQAARRIVHSHLRRAHWLAENVFPLLGW